MNEQLLIRFARKPECLAEVIAAAHSSAYHLERVAIAETVSLTTTEYDAFTRSFLKDRSWLAGKGGCINGNIQAVAVTAPERSTLYINPEGFSYARYVGINPNATIH